MLIHDCKQCLKPHFVKQKISILCPTRERPLNVIKLVSTAITTASTSENLEFLFYVDNDDDSFPRRELNEMKINYKVINGHRQWISNCHNVLYTFATGEILMTAGDDMVFLTNNWDEIVRSKFDQIPDKIALVFGNDNASHAGKIAVHGFFHQHWVHTLGTWVQPGRGSEWDLWATENARMLDRLIYIEELLIEHVHYRQGSGKAKFDSTYQAIYRNNSSFRPNLTYKLIKRERRIDRILLAEAMIVKPRGERNYVISETLKRLPIKIADNRRLLSLSNFEILNQLVSKFRHIPKQIIYRKK